MRIETIGLAGNHHPCTCEPCALADSLCIGRPHEAHNIYTLLSKQAPPYSPGVSSTLRILHSALSTLEDPEMTTLGLLHFATPIRRRHADAAARPAAQHVSTQASTQPMADAATAFLRATATQPRPSPALMTTNIPAGATPEKCDMEISPSGFRK